MKKLCHLSNSILMVSILLIVFFLPGALAHCGDAIPNLHLTTPREIEALIGSCVEIPCIFDTLPEFNSSAPTYGIWMKHRGVYIVGASEIIFNSSGSINTHRMEMIGDVRSKNCSSRLGEAEVGHEDKFYFRVHNSGMSATYCDDFVELKLKDSPWTPSIVVSGSDLKERQSVTITCSVYTPCLPSPPELTWNLKKNSRRQIEKVVDGTFTSKLQETITLSDKHDGYNIKCSARYPVKGGFQQSPETVETLSVSYAPKDTKASISSSGLVSAGSRVVLSCSSRAKPPPSFTWYRNNKDGANVVSTEQRYSFSATPAEKGDYYCKATNGVDSETSTNICIDIIDAHFTPSISISVGDLRERQSVTITCSVATPCPQSQPEFTWNLQQDSLRRTEKNTEGTFTTKIQKKITLSHKHDGYNISCSARHPADKNGNAAKAEVTLSVSYAPRNTSVSISKSSGSWVELSCSSRGKPPPKITWFKKGPKKFTKVATGNFHKDTFTDGDQYYCVAANKLGKQKSSPISLTVKGISGAWVFALKATLGMAALGSTGFFIDKGWTDVNHQLDLLSSSLIVCCEVNLMDLRRTEKAAVLLVVPVREMKKLCHLSNSILMVSILLIVFFLPGAFAHCGRVLNQHMYTPREMEALIGSCVEIPCKFGTLKGYDNSKPTYGIWMKHMPVYDVGASEIIFNSSGSINTHQMEMIGDLRRKNCTTRIPDVKADLTDKYFLRIENGEAKATFCEDPFKLTVIDSPWTPSIVVFGSDLKENQSLTITCSAHTPCLPSPPELTWNLKKDSLGQILKKTDGTFATKLQETITLSDKHDGYNISCTARYPVKGGFKQSASVRTLNVSYAPKDTSATTSPSYLVSKGSRVALSCSSRGNPPITSYTWFKHRKRGDIKLSVAPVYSFFATERANYYCEAKNTFGSERSKTICIDIIDAPLTPRIDIPFGDLKENQSVTITCSASTPCPQSPPKLTWNLQQDSLRQTERNADGTFTTKIQKNITLSDTHDGYNIRCSSRHPAAEKSNIAAKTEVTLSVSYAPRNTSASISQSDLVSAGSRVELSCSSRAKPPPSFTWFRNSGRGFIKVASVFSMSFNAAERGDYYCEATNRLGSEKSKRICLDLIDAPLTPRIDIPFGDLKEGQSVTVTCSASTPCPLSLPELTWNLQQDSLRQTEKNTEGIFTTKIQKNITLSDTHDGYNIKCSSRHPAAEKSNKAKTKVTLSVSYAPRNTSASISPSALVSAGSRVELSCSSRAKPPPNFTWFRNSGRGFITVASVFSMSFNAAERGDYYYAPLTPRIDIPFGDLKEGQSVTITCSASTPCPLSLPELTWNLQQDSLRQTEKNTDGTFTTKIQKNITLSDTHDGYNIRCSSRHPAAEKSNTAKTEVTLNVPYAPRNTSASISPSGLVSAGSRVELSCSSRAKPPPSFTWFRNSGRGFIKVASVFSMSFSAAERGDYYCEATNRLGSEKSKRICLDLIDAPLTPRIDIPFGDLKEGQSVTITCSASTPCPLSLPELTWNLQQDSLRQTEKNTDGIFTTKIQKNITLSDTHDGYNIRCSSRHPAAEKSNIAKTEVTLSVSYAPKDTSATISPSYLVSKGSRVALSCSSRGNPPITSYTWFKHRKRGDIKLSVAPVYSFFATERANYYCEAKNTFGSERSKTICIDIIDALLIPHFNIPFGDLKEGKSVTIKCSASTPCPQSPPELTWNLQQDSLRQTEKNTDGTFTTKIQKNITLSDTHDGYNIICSSRHPAAEKKRTAKTEVTLSVPYAPRNTSASISPSALVSAGSRVELNCSSRAKPPPSFTWFRNSGRGFITVASVFSMSFIAAERGDYYCEATNRLGSEKSKRICLDLIDAPLTPRIDIPFGDLKEGQSVTITCSASTPCPLSLPELTWNLQQDSLRQTEKNTEGIFTTKIQKNITLSDTHDGYNIRCSSRHPAAEKSNIAKTEVTLSVPYAPRNTSASISPSALVSAGSRVELSCSRRAKPPPSFTWFRNSGRGFIKVASVFSMSFNAAERGDYYCEATNRLGSEKSKRICLDLIDAPLTPRIDIPFGDLKEGQPVTVTCSASTPCPLSLPELTWNLQQDSLRQTEKNTEGIFTTKIQKNITLSDTHDGYNIRCSSRHPAAEKSNIAKTEVTLNVPYAPRNTSASISPSGLVSPGSRVEMSCSSRAKPPPSFTWFRNSGRGFIKVASVFSMSFSAAERGDYYCEATNRLGSEKSKRICLDLIDAPLTPRIDIPFGDLKEGQSVTITCSASTPCPLSLPELTWNLQQDSLRQTEKNTDGTFTTKIQKNITLSDTHDGYNIRCSSRHPAAEKSNKAKTEVTLNVPYAPRNTSASISPSALVSAGSRVELSCSSRAKPPPSFTWFRNSGRGFIKVASVFSMSFNAAERGDYYCEATNRLGSEKSKRICLDLIDAPLTPRIDIPFGDLKEGQPVTITCSASTPCPLSLPELTWNLQQDSLRQTEKNTEGIFTTKIQKNITLSDTHDGYNIKCSSRHPAAEKSNIAKTEVTLSVSYAPRNTSASISPSALVSVGSRVELNCSSRAKPPPSFTWFRNSGRGFIKVASVFSMSFNAAERGDYYCDSTNELGSEKSTSICIDIGDAPLTPRISISTWNLREGQSVIVTCSASTLCPHSLPELTWNLQQDSLRHTERNADGTFTTKIQKTITLSDTHDGYNIKCFTRHPAARKSNAATTEVALSVSYAPRNTSASISPPEGNWVDLSCSSRAKPPPKITWFKKGPESTTEVATGNFHKVKFTDGDQYYCVAENKVGKQKSSPINLTVKGTNGLGAWILAIIGAVGMVLLGSTVFILDTWFIHS
ncbi:hemicentin-1-like isoform X3 [Xiphophorus couchianus]|nr:hemicentin-1-like isoform X3 [Xiphophorus couchianus]XP_027860337.1 hemicentin-1-like isoform X3 [Xiphophorus couchianus]XP_027860338.1 hemicentin-1-like isoform X3 [Xiphophorus couchianus]XP_027860339.1 hemicentin-1-like isoform X3 [Xiphophorus couchianus]XP_027860340.1 hemicentin-1-like isoform X3 [Xiphophorus couchianus]XP_027860341.1 hemicentin-1-like isoform X3 [Xiphophorus couchianus]